MNEQQSLKEQLQRMILSYHDLLYYYDTLEKENHGLNEMQKFNYDMLCENYKKDINDLRKEYYKFINKDTLKNKLEFFKAWIQGRDTKSKPNLVRIELAQADIDLLESIC